jgi:hypothetical protein
MPFAIAPSLREPVRGDWRVTAGRLRIAGGPGVYRASGRLDDLKPGRRSVTWLEVGRADPTTTDVGLEPLLRFVDVDRLKIERLASLSLEPLARLPRRLDLLSIERGADLDLGPLANVRVGGHLMLIDLDDRCRVPERLVLPSDLGGLLISADPPHGSSALVERLLTSIAWECLGGLRSLCIVVGARKPFPLVTVDLSFLAELQQLERLDLFDRIEHSGPTPSPLEPPFVGLAKTLTMLRIDAWEPEPLKRALHAHLPLRTPDGYPVGSVYQRYPYTQRVPWEIQAVTDGWTVYGSLLEMPEIAEAADPDAVAAVENDALRIAKVKLKAADPALLRRLDFDQESDGTGISAPAREDLRSALALLGLVT